MSQLFFGYFAGMIAITSILVVALRNPVYSALSLLVMFFHVAGLFVTLHAEFLAAVQIIVYAGAILVLYLFVVMLLNVKEDPAFGPPDPRAVDYRLCRNRSLSVGDIVAVDGRFYACEPSGWQALQHAPRIDQRTTCDQNAA